MMVDFDGSGRAGPALASAVLLATLISTASANADPELVARHSPLLAKCYQEADGTEAKTQCIGALSQACMSQEQGGETTLGISMCNNAEAEFWDDLLNQEYRATMAWAKAGDADDMANFPEFANRADSLRAAQRAWIAFRDAECGLEYASWGSGSMRHITGTDCLMNMAAERTIELRAKREFMQ